MIKVNVFSQTKTSTTLIASFERLCGSKSSCVGQAQHFWRRGSEQHEVARGAAEYEQPTKGQRESAATSHRTSGVPNGEEEAIRGHAVLRDPR